MSDTIIRTHIRWAIRRDYPEIAAIDVAGHGKPWGEDWIVSTLKRNTCIGMVAELPTNKPHDPVAAFMIYDLAPGNIELLRLVVHPDYRRHGIGSQMIAKVLAKLTNRRPTLVVNVPESNLGGCLFLKACGVRARTVIPGIGQHGEDLYRFERGEE